MPRQTADDMRLAGHLRNRFSTVRDDLRTRLWPLPVLAVVIALGLGIALPRLDRAIDDDLAPAVTEFLFGGGAGAARVVLGAIATSLVSVTSLTFSLTVLTLQLASSQYSPRLLRTFARDRVVHLTLALFLAAFTYALTVLRTVRSPEETRNVFVPQISVTLAFALAVASVIALVFFLGHLAMQIRVETILRDVHADAARTLHRTLRERYETLGATAVPTPPPSGTRPLLAPSSGFLVAVNQAALLAAAEETGVVLRIDQHVGASLIAGTPVGSAWRCDGTALDGETHTGLEAGVARGLSTNFERTGMHDIGLGLRQVTDVATKALSPGINDPTTAVHALHHSAALLCELLRRDLSPCILTDRQGAARVVLCQPQFEDLLEMAVRQPCHYGAKDPFVMAALLELLRAVAWVAERPDQRTAVSQQLSRLRQAIDEPICDSSDQARLTTLAQRAEAALIHS